VIALINDIAGAHPYAGLSDDAISSITTPPGAVEAGRVA
jgi:hypothetical protein